MWKVLCSLLAVVTVSVLLTACNTSRTSSDTSKTKMTDSELEDAIANKINSDPQLKAANINVDADVDRTQATLSGTVESEELRTKAVQLAKSAHPGLVIVDKIDVKPREVSRSEYSEEQARTERQRASQHKETVGTSLEDAWIHAKIVAKLIGDKDTPERKINVDVVNGIVTLRGTVDNAQQKAEAERIARATDGVKNVVNQLKVGMAKTY